jgi:hypothetical protein
MLIRDELRMKTVNVWDVEAAPGLFELSYFNRYSNDRMNVAMRHPRLVHQQK